MFGLQLGRLGIAGSLFNESALWPLGAASPGLWIDGPSYPAACWQDSAGTTALSTVGTVLDSSNPVGLMLDRKGGLVLGPNVSLVSSHTFTTYEDLSLSLSLNSAKYYYVEFDYNLSVNSVQLQGDFIGTPYLTVSGTGHYHAYITGGSFLVIHSNGANGTCDNISVRELPGIHLSQATSAARGLASARKNELLATAALATQSVTTTAIPYTISFGGAGTVTASGAHVGALTSGQTFTPTAGTLTLTIAGSVTTAQLERGSAVTSYQRVNTASDYDASAGPTYLKFDGADDSLASATFPAGTLTSSMDCLIAVRRDSAATVALLYGGAPVAGLVDTSGSAANIGAGSPTMWVDGAQLAGGTSVTRNTLHVALTVGAWHILEWRGLDLSGATSLEIGNWGPSWQFNGGFGRILLFASGQDANRDKAKRRMASYFGVTLA